ncbi:MAG: tRNA 2-thiouridine(34) synthase MnmA [Candidatus Aminicenantes bacterium]|jgi:tRNA-specific 2-thiouridylase
MTKNKVVVAMSGGVDSSVAAGLLLEQGYQVIGITLDLFSSSGADGLDGDRKECCGWGAAEDAGRAASKLGISHTVMDLRDSFDSLVVSNFVKEYSRGRTPNPCIRCNKFIKFDMLLERAKKIGASHVATGHYARVIQDPRSGRFSLKKGVDREKDQSYFLYTLTQDLLSHTLFPVGKFTKAEIRKKAREWDLPVAQRPESQEICFIPDNEYVDFLRKKIPESFRSGSIVDPEGRVLGCHNGIIHFTVGQRRGLGIAATHPLYVIAIDAVKNEVIAGPNDLLYKKDLVADRINWISGTTLESPIAAKARVRYKHKEVKALLTPFDSGKIRVEFEEPQRAITPGQAVVFYEGDVVLGGGTILLHEQ